MSSMSHACDDIRNLRVMEDYDVAVTYRKHYKETKTVDIYRGKQETL